MSQEKVSQAQDRALPHVLNGLIEFNSLSEKQRRNFHARLRYIEEVMEEIAEWFTNKDSDFKTFFDDMELLFYVNQGSPSGDNEDVSAYITHSSWTFDTSSTQMRQAVPPSILDAITTPLPSITAPTRDFEHWIALQNTALNRSLNGFYASNDLHSVLSYLLIIDIILSNFLNCALKCRFRDG